MKDEYIKETVSNILDIDQDLYWKEPELFLKDTNIMYQALEEIVLREYTIEIALFHQNFSVVAKKLYLENEDDDEEKFEYAYCDGTNLVKCIFEVLIKVYRQ